MVKKQSNKRIVPSSKTILFLNNQIPQVVLLKISLQANLWNLPYTISGHCRNSNSNIGYLINPKLSKYIHMHARGHETPAWITGMVSPCQTIHFCNFPFPKFKERVLVLGAWFENSSQNGWTYKKHPDILPLIKK